MVWDIKSTMKSVQQHWRPLLNCVIQWRMKVVAFIFFTFFNPGLTDIVTYSKLLSFGMSSVCYENAGMMDHRVRRFHRRGVRLCACDEKTSVIHHRVWSCRGPRFPLKL